MPTFNRPRDFARLLTYLDRHAFGYPVLVLDSSSPDNKATNASLAASLKLDVTIVPFDSSISPFEKFWRGSEQVDTEFCSLCADDDAVIVESIPRLVDFLRTHQDFSAAHGLYFTFYNEGHVGITSIVYSGASLDRDDSLLRLHDLFKRYEAVTYALYRTAVMRAALRRVQPMRSLLARELLGGALTVAAGKVARLPIVYYGRSLSPSLPYQHWHPIDFLISSPQALFDDYAQYRRTLCESLEEQPGQTRTPADLLRLIDLIHLRYLADYVTPHMMDYLVEQVMAGTAPAEIMSGVWPRLSASDPVLRPLWSNRILRQLRARLAPRLRQYQLRWFRPGAQNDTVQATTFAGRPREYRLYEGFSTALTRIASTDSATHVDAIVRGMNAYE